MCIGVHALAVYIDKIKCVCVRLSVMLAPSDCQEAASASNKVCYEGVGNNKVLSV